MRQNSKREDTLNISDETKRKIDDENSSLEHDSYVRLFLFPFFYGWRIIERMFGRQKNALDFA